MDYTKRTITIKSQQEFDAIPDDYQGTIYVEFGTKKNKAIINRSFRYASVVAWDNSSVEARENSSVVAWDNSSVVAWDNSSVVAWDNSSVVARENSSVVARGFPQVVDLGGTIKQYDQARIITPTQDIHTFMLYHGISYTETESVWYKAVRNVDGQYVSDRDRTFIYQPGDVAEAEECDINRQNDCGAGINISSLQWALNYGREWKDLSILEVKANTEDIVLPIYSDGKVRTKKVKVLREVPLEECGLYGKILAKRRK